MEYQLPRNSRKCTATGKAILPGEAYFSVVRETITGLVREDYAATEWKGPPQDAIGYWKGKIPESGPPKPKPITAEAMVGLFEELVTEADPDKLRLSYVLTLLLMRKKVFKLQDVERSGDEEYLLLRVSPGYVTDNVGPNIRVLDPQLTDDETSEVEAELMALLAGTNENEAEGVAATEITPPENDSGDNPAEKSEGP